MYVIRVNGELLMSLTEYDNSELKPMSFPTEEAAKLFALNANFTDYKIEKSKK